MKNSYWLAFGLLFSSLQACTCESGDKSETQATQTAEQEVDDLVIEDLEVGEGQTAVEGKTVAVHYKGTFVDGRTFDSSYDRGEPFVFQLGAGQVIRGWDQGLVGMKEGGSRKLLIPSELAYGERGASQVIPPNTPLVFEIELLEVRE